MKKQYFLLASLALGMAACTNDTLTPDEIVDEENNSQEEVVSNLQHAKLSSFNSSQSRVTVFPVTRADDSEPLQLIAEIDNLSKEEGKIPGFELEDRYLSATCVFYDEKTGTYYTTYHMQGNNYYTEQENETGGYIETFTINENGVPVPGKVYMSANPSELSFDFNHLYFDRHQNETDDYYFQFVGDYNVDDDMESRLIAVGHSSEPSQKEGGKPNTKAIIAKLNFDGDSPTIDYATILTGDKLTDGTTNEDGNLMSLGDEDARDANCVVRKYNHYYVATRKGIANLKASKDELFNPELDKDGNIYFLKTPGSVKYISQPTFTSGVDFLYLTEDTPKDMTANTAIPARIIRNGVNNFYQNNRVDYLAGIESVKDFNWQSGSVWPNISEPIESISPVDGKNVFFTGSLNPGAEFVCLGKNGLYINNPTLNWANPENNIMKFSDKEGGSRPVNGIFVEDWDEANGHHYTDGFIYVANGSCLTILDYYTLEKVAEYSAFKKGEVEDASANFVHVVKTNDYPNNEHVADRIITVAFGQAGVKVFRFTPPVK